MTKAARPFLKFQSCAEACFSLCQRGVAGGFRQPAIAEPVDPFQRGVFHGVEAAADTPSDNAAREGIDDEGDADEADPSGDAGEIASDPPWVDGTPDGMPLLETVID